MITIEALLAMGVLMLVSAAFGYVMRGFIDRERNARKNGDKRLVDAWEDDCK